MGCNWNANTRAGCTVDITAYPVSRDADALSAEDALLKYLDSGAPADRITVSSDGGGCLPVFNERGEVTEMDVGRPASLPQTLKNLLATGAALETVLPVFTSNVADILRLNDRGRIRAGCAADVVVLDENDEVHDVMIAGLWHVKGGKQRISGRFVDSRGET